MSGLSRRKLLRNAAGAVAAAAGAGLSGITGSAQKTGLTPNGGMVPFRLPMGALDYLDQKQYVSNMQVVSHLSGPSISSGEPLMVLWAKGRQRLLPANGGWVDISEAKKPVLMKSSQRLGGPVIYNKTLKKWIMMSTAAAPLTNGTPEHPLGQYEPEIHKLYDNYTGLRGIRNFDVTDPANPKLLGEFSTGAKGMGTHMNFYDGGKYAYLEAGWGEDLRMENSQRAFSNGIMIVDMSDPANVKEVSRWWVPGQKYGEEAEYKKYSFANDRSSWTGNHGSMMVPKRPEDGGTVGYVGMGAFGMYVMDLTDIRNPKPYGKFLWEYETMGGIPFHTVQPLIAHPRYPQLNGILLGTPETIHADCREPYKIPYVIDVKDPRNPKLVGMLPRPQAPKDAPYTDFCQARGRFGSHNQQAWIAPGTARPNIMAVTWFNAGLRVFDLTNPAQPKEVASFVPPRDGDIEKYESWWRGTSENVFVEWDRNLIWLGAHEGTYCLSCPALGAPVFEPTRISAWSVPHANVGWDDSTSASIYLGRGISAFE